MTPPRYSLTSCSSLPSCSQRQRLFEAVQACAGRLGAAALSPSRGQHQRPGKAGSAVFPERASLRSPPGATDAEVSFAGRRALLTLATLAIPSLVGCGFKLREAPVFAFKSVAVPGNTRFVNQVRRNLSTAGTVHLVPAAQAETAEAILDVLAEARERAVVSTTAAGAVRELALRLRVRFRLRTPEGKELMGPSEIVQSRDISYNETAALAKEGEEALLYRDMENDIAQQLLRRLAALKSM